MTWDTSSPADNSVVSAFPANERTQRTFVETIFGVDHISTAGATQGRHNQVTLPERTAPSPVSGYGRLYCTQEGTSTYLYFMDDTGVEIPVASPVGTVGQPLVLPVLDETPTPPAGTGMWYSRYFGDNDVPCICYIDSVNLVEIRYSSVEGQFNIELTEDSITAALLISLAYAEATQYRGAPVTLTVTDDGADRVVVCDLSLGQNYFLSLTENVDHWYFVNAPALRVPTIYVTIDNTGSYTISDWNFTGDVYVDPSWETDLSPPVSARTAYGIALQPGPTLEIYPRTIVAYNP